MSAKGLCAAILTVVTMLAASAVAQDEKNEIGGIHRANLRQRPGNQRRELFRSDHSLRQRADI